MAAPNNKKPVNNIMSIQMSLFDEPVPSPGIGGTLDIDIAREDIAAKKIAEHKRQAEAEQMEIDRKKLGKAPKLKFISFGSGSSGNCAYLGDDRAGVLIDAGVDADSVIKALADNSIPLDNIKAILLTHDHSDHVKYAYTILRKTKKKSGEQGMTLCCTPRALNGLLRRHNISRRIKDYHRAIYKEHPFEIGNMNIIAFETSHDGSDNAGFCISHGAGTFVITTDTGIVTDRADFYMRQANYLVIESNYDDDMLTRGLYPEYLKARIRGERGHLSNVVASSYVSSIVSDALTDVFLCHLSNDNNTHEIAIAAMTGAIRAKGFGVVDGDVSGSRGGGSVRLSVLPRFGSSPLYVLRAIDERTQHSPLNIQNDNSL